MHADEVARRSAEAMWAGDRASRSLGMEILDVGPGRATVRMTVTDDMVNGHAIGHGGYTFTLADSAFAFACNSRNQLTVAAGLTVDFLQQVEGDELLTATATEVSRSGRTGVYDIVVTNRAGERVALVRGRSSTLTGRTVVPVALNEEAP